MRMTDNSGVEDDAQPLVLVAAEDMREYTFIARALMLAGYRVQRAADGRQAVEVVAQQSPEIVVLDLVSSAPDALEVVHRVRARSGAPILVLGERNTVGDRIASLDAGADDYLRKPFAVAELVARLRALLRGRALAVAAARADRRHGILAYADIQLDQDAREATRAGRRLDLRNKAFELLACFLRHPERVLSRRELLEEVWSYEFLGDSNVIEVTVGHVRQALEAADEPRLIHTVRPIGYILRSDRRPAESRSDQVSPSRALHPRIARPDRPAPAPLS